MILEVYAIHDNAVNAYLPPFYARSKGEAIRSFTDAANNQQSNFAKYALDYQLCYLGRFDDSSGVFECDAPRRVIGATEVIVDDVMPPQQVNGSADRRPM